VDGKAQVIGRVFSMKFDHDVVMEPVSTQIVKQRLLEHSPIFDRVYYWLNPFMSETLCQEASK
jgi:hypothetical protein